MIDITPEGNIPGETSVKVSLNNKLNDPIVNAPVKVIDADGNVVGSGVTDNQGKVNIPTNLSGGAKDITVVYDGNDYFTPVNSTIKLDVIKENVTIMLDPIEGIVGENITLTATLTDNRGQKVSGGNLVFKLNGKTLRTDGRFDSNASAWKFNVKDGIVTVTINADLYLRNAKNLTASYSGSYKYNEAKSNTVTAQIKKRNAQITVTTTPTKQKQYNTITFTAKVKDITLNHENNTAINDNTKVLFKINGQTIKDSKGNTVKVAIKNNTASYKYTVPAGMGGISKDGKVRDYTVESVLVSETFYPDTRNTSSFNVERSPITININKVSVNKNNQLSVRADIKDYKNNLVIGNNIGLKINGKTYINPVTNKTQTFKAVNGELNLNNIQVNKDIKIKSVMIVTGARQAYLGEHNETTNIVIV